MDLMDRLASLAQRYEELNTLMAQPEVLADISLLQRYGRERAELEEVVQKYYELAENDKRIAEAQPQSAQRAIAARAKDCFAAQRYYG